MTQINRRELLRGAASLGVAGSLILQVLRMHATFPLLRDTDFSGRCVWPARSFLAISSLVFRVCPAGVLPPGDDRYLCCGLAGAEECMKVGI